MAGKSIAEKAREEAERAEAENPDEPYTGTEQAPDEQEEEEAQESEQPAAPEEPEPTAEDLAKQLDKVMTTFERGLKRVFGDEFQPVPIPMEGALGFLMPGTFEQKSHDNFRRCQTCNGHGVVLTGSLHTGDETTTCPDPRCKGRGYWTKQPPQATTEQPPTLVPVPTQPQQNGEWGEAPAWMGDPSLTPGAGAAV